MMLFVSDFSCFQLKSGKHAGKWKAVAQLQDTAGNKLNPKAIIRPEEAVARKAMDEWLKKRARLLPSLTMTVSALGDAYLARCEQRGRTEETLKSYRKAQGHLKDTIGHIQIGKLTPAQIEAVLEGLPIKTAVNTRAFLRAAINKVARKSEPSLPNVASLAEPPEYHPRSQIQLTPENFAKVLEKETDCTKKAMWLLLSDTGLRPHDEAGCLTWFEIHIREDGWWIQLNESKTDEGRKPIPISEATKEALQALPKTSRYVFPSPFRKKGSRAKVDRHYDQSTWSDWWSEAQSKAGVPITTIYQLRHFFGTVQAGKVKRHVLARLMRHTDVRTTIKYYVDPFPDELRASKD